MDLKTEKKLNSITPVSPGWLNKYIFNYTLEDGTSFDYEVVSRNILNMENVNKPKKSNAVTIIPYDSEGNIYLIREFRYAVNDFVWEVPSGLVDEGEHIEDAAIRELKEETGLSGQMTLYIPPSYSSIGMTDETSGAVLINVPRDYNTPNPDEPVKKVTTNSIKEEIYLYKMKLEDAVDKIMTSNEKFGTRCQLFILYMMAAIPPIIL